MYEKKLYLTEEQIKDMISYILLIIFGELDRLVKSIQNTEKTINRILKRKSNIIIRYHPGRRNIGGKKTFLIKNGENLIKCQKSEYYSKVGTNKTKNIVKNTLKNTIKTILIRLEKPNVITKENRKARDPLYKLISYFRTAIYQVLKESNVDKYGHYFDILQYTPEELITHLELQFKDDMSWDNYGVWHVDHMLPITSFDIREMGDEEFMKCWSLDNLQPMWGEENIRKSNKIL
jgi:hypothetical protein